jgi:hypothetical protein
MPPKARKKKSPGPDLTKPQKDALTKAQSDTLAELLTLHQATKEIKVGYQTIMAAYRSGTLGYAARLDTGEKRQGENGLPLFTRSELLRWNAARKSSGLTVESAARFLAEADPELAGALEKYL